MTTQTPEAKAETQPKKEEPKKQERTFTQAEFNQAMSKQRQAQGAAEKRARAAEERLATYESRIAQLEEAVELAKIAGESEDDQAKAKSLLKRERELAEREKRNKQEHEEVMVIQKRLTIETLSKQYGIPAEDLEQHDNVRDMELAARDYYIEHLKSDGSKSSDGEEKESKRMETGEAKIGAVPIPDPIRQPKEYAEYERKVTSSPEYRKLIR